MIVIDSPYYTQEHEIFRDTARRFIERECLPHREAWQKQGVVSREVWHKAGEAGLLCPKLSPDFGGGGGDIYHSFVIMEEQTRACFNELAFYLHSDIIAPYIECYGTDEQRQRFLPRMATGELVAAIAMTEPSAGSDLQAIRTSATPVDGGYLLNGQKTFISNGQISNLICVAAKTDRDRGAKGMSLFLFETEGAEGFVRGKILKKIGCKSQDSSELFFEDVFVPQDNLLGGQEGQGFYQLMDRLPEERLLMAMSAVVNMECGVAETVEYTKARRAFGRCIMDFQNTRFKLAEGRTEAVIARTFLEHCIDLFIEGKFDPTMGAMIKWWTTERQFHVLDECLQLHGGYGYMMETPITRRYADARLGRIAGGTNEIMKELIGRTL